MSIFLYEFSYFLAASMAILVSVSAFALFIITFRYERQLRTVWRALGFILLAFAFLFLIWERKSPDIGLIAIIIQTFALYSIFKGVRTEPKLVHLKDVGSGKSALDKNVTKTKKGKIKLLEGKTIISLIIVLIFVSLFVLPGYLYVGHFLGSVIEGISVIFILLTIFIQIRRYLGNKKNINLYPLLGYIFLLVRGVGMIFYRLPELDSIFLRRLTLEYSIAWQIATYATFFAFLFLGIWAWNFVKVRLFLRTYVVFITLVILVSTMGALIFQLFSFELVEKNNLGLMLSGAETQSVVMTDRVNTAMFIAKLIADDDEMIRDFKNNNFKAINISAENYLKSAEVDIIRLYNNFGEVVASPSDTRDRGRVFNEDNILAFSITERKQVRTFDVSPGVLAPFVIARAVHPLIDNNKVIGAVEVGYKFDTAFVDFSKEKTRLDVTIYTDKRISATTIKTLDGVSRFVGSEETRQDVLDKVLIEGETYQAVIERFGEIYYSAYSPIRNVNCEIIGMVSVGKPTYLLLEEMRQSLVSTFILVSILSAIISLLGYYAMPSLRFGVKKKKLPKKSKQKKTDIPRKINKKSFRFFKLKKKNKTKKK